MRRLIYESRGRSIELTDDPFSRYFMDFNTFKPNNKTGIFETERVYNQNGITTHNANISELTPRLEFTVFGEYFGSKKKSVAKAVDEQRTLIASIINPLYEGTMTYISYDKAAILKVRPTGCPAESNFDISTGTIDYIVDFYSDSAYWQSRELFKTQTGYIAGGTTFPVTMPVTFGEFVADANIFNNTLIPIYPTLTFNSNNNQIEIENQTTGAIIHIDKSIQSNQKLIVTTDPFNLSANLYTQNGEQWEFVENAIYWISNDSSEDFKLVPGENRLIVNSAGAGSDPACEIEWRLSYDAV